VKKSGTKLTLSRESLRQLDAATMGQAAGGSANSLACTESLVNSCDPASVRICPTYTRITAC
jgi:hypothetical protein